MPESRYQNPQPPEGINTSPDQPLLTFSKLLVGLIIVLVIMTGLLSITGGWLASLLPFEREVRIVAAYPESAFAEPVNSQLQSYLDELSARIQPAMQFPEGMKTTVHYQSEDIENAFATLGGHILLYKGLLKALPNENSLAMLLAHEMAHVKLRHPIRSAGQNLAVTAGLKLLLGYGNVDVLGKAGLYTQLHFSRSMEMAADIEALSALQRVYGHVSGATGLFKTLDDLSQENELMQPAKSAFFSTHPLDQQRIDQLDKIARDNRWISSQDEITPLPADFLRWLDAESES